MKGTKPEKEPPIPRSSDDIQEENYPRCWDFVPADINASLVLGAGERLTGSFVNGKVLISSNQGYLGRVPDPEAREMMEWLRGSDRKLVGQILSMSTDECFVELCAI